MESKQPGLKIDGQAVDAWTVHGEILSGDVYTAFVEAGSNVPVRTVWVDPGINTTERSDYKNVVIGRPPASEFIPNRACCTGLAAKDSSHRRKNARSLASPP